MPTTFETIKFNVVLFALTIFMAIYFIACQILRGFYMVLTIIGPFVWGIVFSVWYHGTSGVANLGVDVIGVLGILAFLVNLVWVWDKSGKKSN